MGHEILFLTPKTSQMGHEILFLTPKVTRPLHNGPRNLIFDAQSQLATSQMGHENRIFDAQSQLVIIWATEMEKRGP